MIIKARMYPHLHELGNHASGIAQVIVNYFKYLPDYGIELVDVNATTYDLDISHAAAHPGTLVNHSHGIMWTGENPALGDYGHGVNRDLVQAVRLAREVTVPSEWVAMPFMRDMRFRPHVIPHGVEFEQWQHNEMPRHVLWAKNRATDGLDPTFVNKLALKFPDIKFVTTIGKPADNVEVIGTLDHDKLKKYIQQSLVLLASDRETFGILPLEAMAAGVPVLTIDSGAVPGIIQADGVHYHSADERAAGYTYDGLDDAVEKLRIMLLRHSKFSDNARQLARQYTWQSSCEKVAGVYRLALQDTPPGVDVVIPCHNYHKTLGRAILSAMKQGDLVKSITVVDDNSSAGIQEIVARFQESDNRIRYKRVEFGNVALARNYGAMRGKSKYLVFVDADDAIEPGFSDLLVGELERDRTAGIAYTSLLVITKDFQADTLTKKMRINESQKIVDIHRDWPGPYDYQEQLRRANQIPTACMIRREAFERTGGYIPLYAPEGAGSEDAELFLRIGACGWGANYVYDLERKSRFVHHSGEGHVSGKLGYEEPDWTAFHPWTKDNKHPFASLAKPENGIAHLVYSYEKPVVSIIIPVGKGHEQVLVNALHSIEAQTVREWEVIVVWDTDNPRAKAFYEKAYPYVHYFESNGSGPSRARNIGIDKAKGELITFLDADDRLLPEYLAKHIQTHRETNSIVYSDFIALLRVEDAPGYGREPGKVSGGVAYIPDSVPDWSCQAATAYPKGPTPYHAAGTNILLPREWMIEFDESLQTWEDVLMGLELSWLGYKFTRIAEPLWMYDMTRHNSRRLQEPVVYEQSMAYIQKKHKEVRDMCGCENAEQQKPEEFFTMPERDTLDTIHTGSSVPHYVTGYHTQKRYGYFQGGERINNVHKLDVRYHPDKFICAYCKRKFQMNKETAWCDCGGQEQAQRILPTTTYNPIPSAEASALKTAPPKFMPDGTDPTDLIAQRKAERDRKLRVEGVTREGALVVAAGRAEPLTPFVLKANPEEEGWDDDEEEDLSWMEPMSYQNGQEEEPDKALSELNINFRSLKALELAGITTVAQAQAAGREVLTGIRGVGERTVDLILEG